jgi:hypothetical protein
VWGAAAFLLAAAPFVDAVRNQSDIEFAKAMVGSRLRDSKSAQYTNVHFVTDTLICGEVNAKNGMGGYTGYVSFAVYAWPHLSDLKSIVASQYKDLFSEVLIGYDDRMRASIQELCREN